MAQSSARGETGFRKKRIVLQDNRFMSFFRWLGLTAILDSKVPVPDP
jgi:hypothetical protein